MMGCSSAITPGFSRVPTHLPEAADFLRRFAGGRIFAHRQSSTQRILVIAAHDDERFRQNVRQVECRFIAE